MKVLLSIFTILFLAIACNSRLPIAPDPTPTVLPAIPLDRQPIPLQPKISGAITGLLESDDLVTISISDQSGIQINSGLISDNVPWAMILTNVDQSESDYIVTAVAEGYITQPSSYSIRIQDGIPYLVVDNMVGEEAVHLDFSFMPEE